MLALVPPRWPRRTQTPVATQNRENLRLVREGGRARHFEAAGSEEAGVSAKLMGMIAEWDTVGTGGLGVGSVGDGLVGWICGLG